ncbi:MAG: nucleotidyltransferase substrate binding protein [Ignavibacteriaceae bacterium]|nr:nucleotidyltransferase substrate binding protein [Ignavibacteriaceae bacterium]
MNFEKALLQLKDGVQLAAIRELSQLETQGLIQAFEFTHELAWNTLKDFLESKGYKNIYGSKDTTKEAFRLGLIENGKIWMDMIQSRNKSSHIYDEETAMEIAVAIRKNYKTEFEKLQGTLNKLSLEEGE